jgi:hypothetical protein
MDNSRRASTANPKKDTRRVGRGLGEGLGVLLPGVTASFLAKDAFGHDDGNRAIVAGYFFVIVAYFSPRGARDLRFRLRSGRRK